MYKIEDYLGCIIKVLNKYSLPSDEFWDVGLIGLEKAIQKFDKSRTTMKPQTYFIYQIEWHIAREIESKAVWCGFVKKHSGRHYIWFLLNYKLIKNCCNATSIDDIYLRDGYHNFEYKDEYHKELTKISVKDFYKNYLNERETTICKMRVEGYTLDEIGKVIGCSRQNVSLTISKIKKKMIEYFGEEKCGGRIQKRNKSEDSS